MTSAQIIIVVTIVLYLAAMVLVGVYFGKKGSGSSSDDFYLGGRKMGPIVTAMSAEASDMSSYLLMGLPGLAYLFGLPEVTWTTIAGGTDLSSGRILSCDGFNSTAGDITYAVAVESGLLEGIITHLGERRLTLQ